VGGEEGLDALEHFANIIAIADAAHPLDGIDDQDDFAIGIGALTPHILYCFECEFACLLDQLLDDTAGLFLQLLLEGRVLLQGGFELDPADRYLDLGELNI